MTFRCNQNGSSTEIGFNLEKGARVPPITLCRKTIPQSTTNLLSKSISSRASSHFAPKLANNVQYGCDSYRLPTINTLIEQFHFYDFVVSDVPLLNCFSEYFGKDGIIRTRNPYTILVSYWSPDVNLNQIYPEVIAFLKGIKSNYIVRDANGNPTKLGKYAKDFWGFLYNLGEEEALDYLINFIKDNVISELNDGIYYDWTSTSLSYLNNRSVPLQPDIDYDNDGIAETDNEFDDLWFNSYKNLLERSREIFPEGYLLCGNAGSGTGITPPTTYVPYLNGFMLEAFMQAPIDFPSLFSWSSQMRSYSYCYKEGVQPNFSFLQLVMDDYTDYKSLRFGLVSALMFDGYFSATTTPPYRTDIEDQWYDEYTVNLTTGEGGIKDIAYKGYLGSPIGEAYNAGDLSEKLYDTLHAGGTTAQTKAWRRDYANGIVLCNPTTGTANITLGGTFKKINGTINPSFNDGSTITSISLATLDGCVLLRI